MNANNCLSCGLELSDGRKDKKYCSPACRQKKYREGFHQPRIHDKNMELKNGILIAKENKIPCMNDLIVETTKQIREHFNGFGPYMLYVFIYYKIKWNLFDEPFVKQMKWYIKNENVFNWFYASYNAELCPRTKDQQIEYENYCKFLKSLN